MCESKLSSFITLVIALYSKSNTKNSKHAAITTSTSIATVSRIVVQIFEHTFDREFRSFPSAFSTFQTKGFALIHPIALLTLLSSTPNTQGQNQCIQVSRTDADLWKVLNQHRATFIKAMKESRKRKRGVEEDDCAE